MGEDRLRRICAWFWKSGRPNVCEMRLSKLTWLAPVWSQRFSSRKDNHLQAARREAAARRLKIYSPQGEPPPWRRHPLQPGAPKGPRVSRAQNWPHPSPPAWVQSRGHPFKDDGRNPPTSLGEGSPPIFSYETPHPQFCEPWSTAMPRRASKLAQCHAAPANWQPSCRKAIRNATAIGDKTKDRLVASLWTTCKICQHFNVPRRFDLAGPQTCF